MEDEDLLWVSRTSSLLETQRFFQLVNFVEDDPKLLKHYSSRKATQLSFFIIFKNLQDEKESIQHRQLPKFGVASSLVPE